MPRRNSPDCDRRGGKFPTGATGRGLQGHRPGNLLQEPTMRAEDVALAVAVEALEIVPVAAEHAATPAAKRPPTSPTEVLFRSAGAGFGALPPLPGVV